MAVVFKSHGFKELWGRGGAGTPAPGSVRGLRRRTGIFRDNLGNAYLSGRSPWEKTGLAPCLSSLGRLLS
jgi:hypothetical protein